LQHDQQDSSPAPMFDVPEENINSNPEPVASKRHGGLFHSFKKTSSIKHQHEEENNIPVDDSAT
jgi:hypothetical protein